MVSENAYDVMMFMMLCTSNHIHIKQTSPQVQDCMGFVGKYPLEIQLVQLVLESNWVLGNLNITDLSSLGIILVQSSLLATEISGKSDLNERSIEYQSISDCTKADYVTTS